MVCVLSQGARRMFTETPFVALAVLNFEVLQASYPVSSWVAAGKSGKKENF